MPDISKILVIKLKHIGDVLLATPVIQALQERYPQGEISVLVPRGTEEILQNHPAIREILIFDRAVKRFSISSLIQEELGLVRRLRRGKFDLAVDLSDGDRGAILARLSGAPVRLGYRRRKGLLGRDKLFTAVADHDFRKSVIASHADVLALIGIAGPLPSPRIVPTGDARQKADRLLQSAGVGPSEPLLIFHPTSRWMFKSWEAANCARLADMLARKGDMRVAFTCGPEEKELKKIRQIMAQVREPVLDLSGKTTLAVLAALIARSRAFIGVDSAPMHMAHALGVPTLSIFGPSDPVQWAPSGPTHRTVTKRWACQPCHRDGCMGSKVSQCLTDLTVEEVAAAVEEWLAPV